MIYNNIKNKDLSTHITEFKKIFVEPYYWTYKNGKEVRVKWNISQREKALQAIKKSLKTIRMSKLSLSNLKPRDLSEREINIPISDIQTVGNPYPFFTKSDIKCVKNIETLRTLKLYLSELNTIFAHMMFSSFDYGGVYKYTQDDKDAVRWEITRVMNEIKTIENG